MAEVDALRVEVTMLRRANAELRVRQAATVAAATESAAQHGKTLARLVDLAEDVIGGKRSMVTTAQRALGYADEILRQARAAAEGKGGEA